jgi:glutathione S-transferase
MILYGSSLSPYVRKVLAFAEEKGMALELKPVGLSDRSPEFVEASPFGKMPAFRDGDYTLADSSAIVHYLEARQPDPALIPADAKLRGKCIWFEEFADTILFNCGGKIFFNLVVAPRFMGRPGDPEAARQAELNELPPLLDYLERVVPGDDGYLVGDGLTLADIAVASPFANFRHTGTKVDPARYPRTSAYIDRILARPSLAQWVERESAFLAREPAQ